MSPTYKATTSHLISTPARQPSKKAFQPTKKPRTSLGAIRTPSKGGASVGASHSPGAPPRRERRALKKGASPTQRTPSNALRSGAGSEGGNRGGVRQGGSDLGGAGSGGAGSGGGKPRGGGSGDVGSGDVGSGEGDPLPITSAHEAAFARVLPEIAALPREEARPFTVHVPSAAMLGLGSLPKMLAFREAMIATLVAPPLEALDKLNDYALTAVRAYAYLALRDDGETRVRTLLAEASPLRERLLASAELLVTFGLLDAKKVAAIRRGTGRLDTAQDLLALARLFLGAWPSLASKTPLTRAEIERADALGDLLVTALGCQQQGTDGSDEPDELDDQLAKAYELYRRAYEACRRAILYLRFYEGDADEIAPPLGQSRRRARRPGADAPNDDEPGGDAPPPAPADPAPADPGGGEADAG
jgi:hypothetical protein